MKNKASIPYNIRQIADIFKAMRELLCIKQKDLAKEIGITKGALSLFESMKATINEEKIFKIAEILHINPAWIKSESEVFLKSDEILYLTAKKEEPLLTFQRYANDCFYLHIFKTPHPLHSFTPKYLLKQEFVVTVGKVGDVFCIIRTPDLKSSEDFNRYFMYKALSDINIHASYFILENFENKKEILEKIENKMITKEELLWLYKLAKVATAEISLSIEEKELILALRLKKISATEAKKIVLEHQKHRK